MKPPGNLSGPFALTNLTINKILKPFDAAMAIFEKVAGNCPLPDVVHFRD